MLVEIVPMETMNQRLVEARKRAGYVTATEAAEAHGWTVPTYLAHENGTRGFRIDTAKMYARAFRVPLNWLMDGSGPPPDQEGPEAERRTLLRGIKLGLQFAGIAPETREWHEAIAKALGEYDSLPEDGTAATGKRKVQNRATQGAA